MNQTPFDAHSLFGGDERARILRLFLSALMTTPWLLFIESARRIVSWKVTLLTITLGIFLGSLIAVGLADINLEDVNDVTASIVTVVCICVATIALWLIVPHQYIGTILQFSIVFTWTVPVTQLLYHRYRAPESS